MAEPRTQLKDLVSSRKAELGLSLRALEAACIDPKTGVQVKYSWLHRLINGKPTEAPFYESLVALSLGIQVPLKAVQDAAAAQYMGVVQDAIWSKDRSTRLTVARMSELSPEGRAELAEMVELWTRRNKAADPNAEPQ